jgi:uncharacterized protein YcgI (DUF1989 family)
MATSRTERAEVIPAGGSWSAIIQRGEILRIIDTEGQQGIDSLCYATADPQERYNAANTLKRAGTLRLTTGQSSIPTSLGR